MRLFPLQIITKTWLILAAESNRFFWSVSKEFYFFPFNILFIFIVITQFLGKIASQILVLFGVLNTLFATVARFCCVILLLLSWFCHTFSQVLALKMYRDKKGEFVCWHYSLKNFWLKVASNSCQHLYFVGSVLPPLIIWGYKKGINRMRNHWWTSWWAC